MKEVQNKRATLRALNITQSPKYKNDFTIKHKKGQEAILFHGVKEKLQNKQGYQKLIRKIEESNKMVRRVQNGQEVAKAFEGGINEY